MGTQSSSTEQGLKDTLVNGYPDVTFNIDLNDVR